MVIALKHPQVCHSAMLAVGEIGLRPLLRVPYYDGDTVNVLSCFHQHREPKTRQQLLSGSGFNKGLAA